MPRRARQRDPAADPQRVDVDERELVRVGEGDGDDARRARRPRRPRACCRPRTTRPAGSADGTGERAGSAAGGYARGSSSEPHAGEQRGGEERDEAAAHGRAVWPVRLPRSSRSPRHALRRRSRSPPASCSTRRGEALGTPRPPLVFDVDRARDARRGSLLAVVVLARRSRSCRGSRALPPAAFAAALLGLALAVRLAVGATRFGPEGWDDPFNESFDAKNEYVPALPGLDAVGVRLLPRPLRRARSPRCPVHAAGHPPGLLLVLHWLGLDTPGAAAALVIASARSPSRRPTSLARSVLDEERARIAGAAQRVRVRDDALRRDDRPTSLYAALGAGAAALLLARAASRGAARARRRELLLLRGARGRRVGGARSAPPAAHACGIAARLRRRARRVLRGALRRSPASSCGTSSPRPRRSTASRSRALRPYAFWLFGSPAAFLAFLGLPITWYAARALGERHPAAVALAIVIVIRAVGGFTKAETERIWLMYVPLACVAAAAVAAAAAPAARPRTSVHADLGVELLFGTVW